MLRILFVILAVLSAGWIIYHAIMYTQTQQANELAAAITAQIFLWRGVAGLFALLFFGGGVLALGWRE